MAALYKSYSQLGKVPGKTENFTHQQQPRYPPQQQQQPPPQPQYNEPRQPPPQHPSDTPVANVLQTQDYNHKMRIIRENPIVCVKIFGHWCGPCKMIAPVFEDLSKQYTGIKYPQNSLALGTVPPEHGRRGNPHKDLR